MKKVTSKNDEYLNTFEKRLVDARTRLNLSQQNLAKKTHLFREQINYFEKGTRKPDIDKLMSIADTLNVSIDYLLCRTNSRDVFNTSISSETGLSDNAIGKLKAFTTKDSYQRDILYGERFNYQDFSMLINKIIEHDKFESLIYFLRAYINSQEICRLEEIIKQEKYDYNEIEDYTNDYDIYKKDIYKFKIVDIFTNIINDITNKLKNPFAERWILDESENKILKKCKDGSEQIEMLKNYGGVKDNGSTRTNKK